MRNTAIREALKLSEQTLGEDIPTAEMKQKAEPQDEAEASEKRAEGSQEKPTPTSERKIFRENATADATHKGMQIDRKRRRALQEKRIAMGHKPDDHEEQQRM